ncbi:MAG: S1 RNA-binding domain-containing protein, partial [Pseudomonadales bacterium]|nr:S1 RNA-binding domain-containing protein [Pseudomonadales bacterium]
PSMILEGTVTNVTNFGAFVDIGVHQDGLVHVSALADKFVEDPHDVVKPGDIVKVKVLEVDLDRKRISLTMRMDDQPAEKGAAPARNGGGQRKGGQRNPRQGGKSQGQNKGTGTFGQLLANAMAEKRGK